MEICDINNEGITSKLRTVHISKKSNPKFNLLILKQMLLNIFISGKHVDDVHTIDYQAIIPIVINQYKN